MHQPSEKTTIFLHRLKVLLKKLRRKSTISHALLIRVLIVLLAARMSTAAIATALHVIQATARKWRKRWEATTQVFVIAIRKSETKRQLTNRIIEILDDAHLHLAPRPAQSTPRPTWSMSVCLHSFRNAIF